MSALQLMEGEGGAVFRRAAAAGVMGGQQKLIRGEFPLSAIRCSNCSATSGGEGAAAAAAAAAGAAAAAAGAAAADAHPQEEATRPAALSAQRETLDDSRW